MGAKDGPTPVSSPDASGLRWGAALAFGLFYMVLMDAVVLVVAVLYNLFTGVFGLGLACLGQIAFDVGLDVGVEHRGLQRRIAAIRPADDAELAADVLAKSDLRGIDFPHVEGVLRLTDRKSTRLNSSHT